MCRWRAIISVVSLVGLGLIGAGGGGAQAAPAVRVDPSGVVQVMAGDVVLGLLDLNAHGPQWQHAPQTAATVQASALPEGQGQRFVGKLPIPNTEGGVLEFTETVTEVPQGVRVRYEVTVPQPLKLNGLQVSLVLGVGEYGGQTALVLRPDDYPSSAIFPLEKRENASQLWSGEGHRMEIASNTGKGINLELQAPAGIVIQDLRHWDQPTFEIRIPAIMEDPPREVGVEERFHLDLTLTVAEAAVPATP